MHPIRSLQRGVCPLANVPSRARTRARDTAVHARCLQHADRCPARHASGYRPGARTSRSDRAHAGRTQVQADQDRGAELRGRAPEALALRHVQREPGRHDAGGTVRRHRGRHRAGGPRGPGRARAAARSTGGQAPGGATGAARKPAAHRSSPRDPADALRMRPGPQAHRRRDQRATRLRAGTVLRAAPHPRQVRLHVLPDHPGRTAAGTDDRQGHPGAGAAGAGGGGQARRSPAAVPAAPRSTLARVYISRARAWRSGLASAACD